MWRSLFLALGAYTCLMGVECLLIDRAVLASSQPPTPGLAAKIGAMATPRKVLEPPDWAPWSLLSVGAVTVLYSITLPRKSDSK